MLQSQGKQGMHTIVAIPLCIVTHPLLKGYFPLHEDSPSCHSLIGRIQATNMYINTHTHTQNNNKKEQAFTPPSPSFNLLGWFGVHSK